MPRPCRIHLLFPLVLPNPLGLLGYPETDESWQKRGVA